MGLPLGALGNNTIWIAASIFLAGCSLGGENCKEFDPIKFKGLAEGYIANSRERSAKRGLFKSEYSQATVRLEDIRRPTAEERVSDVAGVVSIDLGHRRAIIQIDNECNFSYFDQ